MAHSKVTLSKTIKVNITFCKNSNQNNVLERVIDRGLLIIHNNMKCVLGARDYSTCINSSYLSNSPLIRVLSVLISLTDKETGSKR